MEDVPGAPACAHGHVVCRACRRRCGADGENDPCLVCHPRPVAQAGPPDDAIERLRRAWEDADRRAACPVLGVLSAPFPRPLLGLLACAVLFKAAAWLAAGASNPSQSWARFDDPYAVHWLWQGLAVAALLLAAEAACYRRHLARRLRGAAPLDHFVEDAA